MWCDLSILLYCAPVSLPHSFVNLAIISKGSVNMLLFILLCFGGIVQGLFKCAPCGRGLQTGRCWQLLMLLLCRTLLLYSIADNNVVLAPVLIAIILMFSYSQCDEASAGVSPFVQITAACLFLITIIYNAAISLELQVQWEHKDVEGKVGGLWD